MREVCPPAFVSQSKMINYGTAFTFFFKDKDWLCKFAIATLLTFSIVGLGPVIGWTLELVRRVKAGDETELPDWAEWRAYWKSMPGSRKIPKKCNAQAGRYDRWYEPDPRRKEYRSSLVILFITSICWKYYDF